MYFRSDVSTRVHSRQKLHFAKNVFLFFVLNTRRKRQLYHENMIGNFEETPNEPTCTNIWWRHSSTSNMDPGRQRRVAVGGGGCAADDARFQVRTRSAKVPSLDACENTRPCKPLAYGRGCRWEEFTERNKRAYVKHDVAQPRRKKKDVTERDIECYLNTCTQSTRDSENSRDRLRVIEEVLPVRLRNR